MSAPDFIVYPAIDLRGGRVVRLQEGDPARQTVFNDNPADQAQQWIDAGAAWLHVVNLDGAFAQANANERILSVIAQLGVPVQFGGGMRDLADIERALNAGAARVVLGTIAATQPQIVGEAVARFGADAICVGLDSRDGVITISGWQQQTTITPAELGTRLADMGARHALYTDVTRDGLLTGANIDATIALADATGLRVIASGGVGSADDITTLAARGAAGAVIGMALYTGKLTLQAALAAAKGV
jgi:phosphoribosylformimino-5-aminoimidazole carboxamide ribotide isomerase